MVKIRSPNAEARKKSEVGKSNGIIFQTIVSESCKNLCIPRLCSDFELFLKLNRSLGDFELARLFPLKEGFDSQSKQSKQRQQACDSERSLGIVLLV
jgi:hypothetical protein